MKHRSKILLAASLVMLLVSCKKDYLETSPTDQIATISAFSTTTNAWAALNGMHRYMYTQWLGNQDQGGQSANMIYMDAMGDDLVLTSSSNSWFLSEYRWISHRNANSRVPLFNYLFYYTLISNANLIIQNIDGATGPDTDKKAIKGEALAYRGWAYFQMVQLFGKRFDKANANDGLGVPLVLTPSTTATPRATVAEVYTQINKDLDDAIASLAGYTRLNKSHINVNVAKGFKARVALAQQSWPVAAQMAADARAGFGLLSNADYTSGFNDYTKNEWMWGMHQQADQTTYFYSFFAFMSSNFNSSNIRVCPKAINSTLYDLISATDIRKTLWDPTGTNTAFIIPTATAGAVRKPYMNRKFLVADQGNSIGDFPLMRASEMYLIEAEAKARIGGQDAAAATALFTLAKQRDANYVLSTNTGTALIDEIMIQRRVELWGEGFRFYDLKRLDLPLDRTNSNHNASIASVLNVSAGDKTWQFLIPQSEINNTNGVVVQNDL
ncbi:MAG: RagB/SusD family nutrient uptake outer membrane protein [Ferruginibacter sp.]